MVLHSPQLAKEQLPQAELSVVGLQFKNEEMIVKQSLEGLRTKEIIEVVRSPLA